ncbi:MAG: DUF1667 domain-containing protein, partial [Spirochaetota bacterium]
KKKILKPSRCARIPCWRLGYYKEGGMTKELICITCPLGCRLTVSSNGENDIAVSGNKCSRGFEYAQEEMRSPKRVVTATIRLVSKDLSRLPVKTSQPLPREYIDELLRSLYSLETKAPLNCGDVIVKNFKGTGIDVVATQTCR